jgi:hypothetical protein
VTALLKARKNLLGSLAAIVVVWGPVAQADGFHQRDFWALAASLVTAFFGVHQATNEPEG